MREATSLIYSARAALSEGVVVTERDEDGRIVSAEWVGKAKRRREQWDHAAYRLLLAAWYLRGKPDVDSL